MTATARLDVLTGSGGKFAPVFVTMSDTNAPASIIRPVGFESFSIALP